MDKKPNMCSYERALLKSNQERDRYKRMLQTIAHNDSGWSGDKAREALHPETHHPRDH